MTQVATDWWKQGWNNVSSFLRCEHRIMDNEMVAPLDASGVEVLPAPSATGAVMTRCGECHHLVPEANLAIHQATACNRHETTTATNQQQTSEERDSPQQQRPNWLSGLFGNRRNNDNRRQDATDTSNLGEDWHMVERGDAVDNRQRDNEWPCPRCTLSNSTSSEICSACNYSRQQQPNTVAQQQSPQQEPFTPPPGSFMGGGALVGGIVGALLGGLVGNPIGGAIEGAMNGAFSGAIIENASRAQQRQQRQQAATSVSRGHLPNRMPMTRVRYPDGTVQIFAGDPSTIRALHSRNGGLSYEQQVLQQSFERSDEQTRNRGADEQVLASLPVTRVEKEEMSDQCVICLESFRKGDSYKTLPCLHGFHARCVDHWLRKNASCPMCKHEISS